MNSDLLYLEHVLEGVRRIEEYIAGGRDSFFQSTLVEDAVIRNLQTLAESAKRVSSPADSGEMIVSHIHYRKFPLNHSIIRTKTSRWCSGSWNKWPSLGYTTIWVFTPSVFSACQNS